jgi:hypothetical protein
VAFSICGAVMLQSIQNQQTQSLSGTVFYENVKTESNTFIAMQWLTTLIVILFVIFGHRIFSVEVEMKTTSKFAYGFFLLCNLILTIVVTAIMSGKDIDVTMYSNIKKLWTALICFNLFTLGACCVSLFIVAEDQESNTQLIANLDKDNEYQIRRENFPSFEFDDNGIEITKVTDIETKDSNLLMEEFVKLHSQNQKYIETKGEMLVDFWRNLRVMKENIYICHPGIHNKLVSDVSNMSITDKMLTKFMYQDLCNVIENMYWEPIFQKVLQHIKRSQGKKIKDIPHRITLSTIHNNIDAFLEISIEDAYLCERMLLNTFETFEQVKASMIEKLEKILNLLTEPHVIESLKKYEVKFVLLHVLERNLKETIHYLKLDPMNVDSDAFKGFEMSCKYLFKWINSILW